MFAAGMAWGVRRGLLAAADYTPTIDAAWRCLSARQLAPSGAVGGCQPANWEPAPFAPDDTSSFCVGQFLMAAAEVAALAAAESEAGS